MPFTVDEFRDLIRLLHERPEWRTELRQLILAEELLAVPDLMRQLVGQVDRLTGQVQELAGGLTQLTDRVDRLAEVQADILVDTGKLKGSDLERRYRERPFAYFSRVVRRARTLSADEIVALIAPALEQGQITSAEEDELMLADAVVRGRRPDGEEAYLVVEVSWGVGVDDVRRAGERAALLRKTGVVVLPVVAGDWVTADAQRMAEDWKVWQVTDGSVVAPGA